jgi:DNA-3-methyladenine glycosylase II
MSEFRIVPQGPFHLDRAREFLLGFTPAFGAVTVEASSLRLAFRADGEFERAGVSIRQERGEVITQVYGDASAAVVKEQICRILSLDHDARPFVDLAAENREIAAALAEQPGFRPVVFPSPYEAAIWGILAQGISMRGAALSRPV